MSFPGTACYLPNHGDWTGNSSKVFPYQFRDQRDQASCVKIYYTRVFLIWIFIKFEKKSSLPTTLTLQQLLIVRPVKQFFISFVKLFNFKTDFSNWKRSVKIHSAFLQFKNSIVLRAFALEDLERHGAPNQLWKSLNATQMKQNGFVLPWTFAALCCNKCLILSYIP